MRTLTMEEKEELLESNITEEQSEIVTKKFEGLYGKIKLKGVAGKINSVMCSWYLLSEQNRARKFEGNLWSDCTDEDIDAIKAELTQRKTSAINNARPLFTDKSNIYYGLYSYTDEWLDEDIKTAHFIFKLVKYTNEENADARTISRGQNCMTFTTDDLKSIITSLKLVPNQPAKVTLCDQIKTKLMEANAMIRE